MNFIPIKVHVSYKRKRNDAIKVGEVPSNTTFVFDLTELHPPLFHKHFGMERLKFETTLVLTLQNRGSISARLYKHT